MNLTEIIVNGTLNADGTLELDQKPSLPPGRVRVALQRNAEPLPPHEDWWQFMQRSRKELEAAGCRFMNAEKMNTHLEWLREEDRIDELLRQAGQRKDSSGC